MPTAPQEQVTTEAMKREGMVTREICTGPWGLLIKRFPSHLECGILFQVNFCTLGDSCPIFVSGRMETHRRG